MGARTRRAWRTIRSTPWAGTTATRSARGARDSAGAPEDPFGDRLPDLGNVAHGRLERDRNARVRGTDAAHLSVLAGGSESARAALAFLERIHHVERDLHDRHDDELRDALERVHDEGRLPAVPAR